MSARLRLLAYRIRVRPSTRWMRRVFLALLLLVWPLVNAGDLWTSALLIGRGSWFFESDPIVGAVWATWGLIGALLEKVVVMGLIACGALLLYRWRPLFGWSLLVLGMLRVGLAVAVNVSELNRPMPFL